MINFKEGVICNITKCYITLTYTVWCYKAVSYTHLDVYKRQARWVPRFLTLDQKQCRKDVSTDYLALYTSNPTKFYCWFITVDETWVHHGSGIIFIDYLKREKQLLASTVYLLHLVKDEIKKKRPHLAKNKVLFQQDNALIWHANCCDD